MKIKFITDERLIKLMLIVSLVLFLSYSFLRFKYNIIYEFNGTDESKLEKINEYNEKFLGMDCNVMEYDIKWIPKKNFRISEPFKDLIIDAKSIEFDDNGIFYFKTILLEKTNVYDGLYVVLTDSNGKLVDSYWKGNWDNILGKEQSKYKIGIYKDENLLFTIFDKFNWFYEKEKLLYSDIKRIDEIDSINNKLVFYGEDNKGKVFINIDGNFIYGNSDFLFKKIDKVFSLDKNLIFSGEEIRGKNFININGEVKYTPNNYIFDSYKKKNEDVYISYKDASDKYSIYKNNIKIYETYSSESLDYGILNTGEIYTLEGSGIQVNGKIIDIKTPGPIQRLVPSKYIKKVIHTSNNEYKIYLFELSDSTPEETYIQVNDKYYHIDTYHQASLSEVSPDEKEVIFNAESYIYRVIGDKEIKEELSPYINGLKLDAIKYTSDGKVFIGINNKKVFKKYTCDYGR